jgi:hypothetical protein
LEQAKNKDRYKSITHFSNNIIHFEKSIFYKCHCFIWKLYNLIVADLCKHNTWWF